MFRTLTTIGVSAVVVIACGKNNINSDTRAAVAGTPIHAIPAVPNVPRFPAGLPSKGVAEWDKLKPACKSTSLRDIRPCMESFVDYGSILGLVTLVDNKALGVQVDAVGQFNPNTIFQIMSMNKPFVSVAIMKLVERGQIFS